MKRAVFPGSFDPFTLGHLDIVKSALKLFDSIIIAVGSNVQKSGFFTTEQRMEIIRRSTAGIAGVEVDCYHGLTIDYCNKREAGFIVRGLRTTTDFELERVIAQANLKMNPSITTVFIPSSNDFAFITSTVVRDVFVNGGDTSAFMASGADLEQYRKERK